MIYLLPKLELKRCPHCSVNWPHLRSVAQVATKAHDGKNERLWFMYSCAHCGGVVTAAAKGAGQTVTETYPKSEGLSESIPNPARSYLEQAIDSVHAPAGSVMLAASAVDAMLKVKGYTDGSLYTRIDAAASNHAITPDMATWAHEVRLDANDQRHADPSAALPTESDAHRAIGFASALGTILFVLPARVQRGLQEAKGKE